MSADCGSTNCEDALTELQRFLDGELPVSELEQIRQHLVDCFPCADRASFEEQLRSIVRRGCAETAPSTLVDRIRLELDGAGDDRPGR